MADLPSQYGFGRDTGDEWKNFAMVDTNRQPLPVYPPTLVELRR